MLQAYFPRSSSPPREKNQDGMFLIKTEIFSGEKEKQLDPGLLKFREVCGCVNGL